MIMPQSTEDSINKLIENKFYSSKKFAEEIEKIAHDNKDMSYIDAIVFLLLQVDNFVIIILY